MKIPKIKPIEDSRLLAQQAQRLRARPLSAAEAQTIGAQENPDREASRALAGDYVNTIARPLRVRPGQIADPTPINDFFRKTKDDLEIITSISKDLEAFLVATHNVVATKENDIIGELKTLRDKIAVLKLYATDITDDDLYVAFTFTDGTKIDVPGSGDQLTYEETEGALMLPVVGIVEPEIESITIAGGSNGMPGNNFDRTRQRNGALEALIDGQPSTMFEYERVGDRRSGPLRLTLRLQLKEPTIINRIVINPANLGTTEWVKVKDIELQVDQRFVSIKDDIQSPSWDLSNDPFRLSPAASKYAGQGVYTFKPRMVKAVQITLTQDEPYPILNGRRDRYVIALREINLQQVEFKKEGVFLLREQSFQRPVRALGFIQNLKPFEEALASIDYSVSTNGGESWVDIASFENKDVAKTEALVLDAPSSFVTIQGTIKRLSEGFRNPVGQGEENLIDRSRVHSSGTVTGPISLEAIPQHYLEVIETRYGHSGNYGPKFFLGRTTGTLGNAQVIELPMVLDKDDLTLLVNGQEWPRVVGFTDTTTEGFVYTPNGDYPSITLGDGTDPDDGGFGGALPPAGAELYLKISKGENPQVEPIQGGFKFHLKYGASKVRESTAVIFRDLKIRQTSQTAGPDTTIVELPWEHADIEIQNIGTPELDYIADGVAVPFQNGEVEFQNLAPNNYYSVDYENGRIHLADPVPRDGGDLTVEYEYTLRTLIPDAEWKYADRENAIEVKSALITPKQGSKRQLEQLVKRVLDLDGVNLRERPYSIIPGTVQGVDENGVVGISRVLQTEVKYINGSAEFERLRLQGGSLLGYFSVNYKENALHLPRFDGLAAEDQGFLPGKIIWQYISSEIHYNLGRKLEIGREYMHKDRTIETTPYFLDRLVDLNRRLGRSVDLHIRYNYIGEAAIDGVLLEKYYSPVLRDLAVVGIGIDPRLGTLESL